MLVVFRGSFLLGRRFVVPLLHFIFEGLEFDFEGSQLFLLREELLLPVLHFANPLGAVRRHCRVELLGSKLDLALTKLNLLLLL